MRIRLLTKLAVIGPILAVAQPASAQLAVGPVPYQESVDGVPVTINVLSVITVQANPDSLAVTAKIDGDLFDLQRKIGAIVDTFRVPNNNCASAELPNLVVSLTSKSLTAQGDRALLTIGGRVDAWTCVAKAKSEVQWVMEKIGPIKTKAPVRRTFTNTIKTEITSEPFDATVPLSFVRQGADSVAVRLEQPTVLPEGLYATAANGVLKIADVDLTQQIANAVHSALDPIRLKTTIPPELEKLNMTVQSAGFKDDGGHLVAEVVMTANVPWGEVANALKQIQSPPTPQ